MKNDITYEYRVFTNRLVDVGTMEVGVCTSKSIKELKPKDKVDGRFFHTSDNDEWYFCWNGELQKLNLKGNAGVNDALEKAEQLIAAAQRAADTAKDAADVATAAVESIEEVSSIANDAKTDAATAKTTAEQAKTIADSVAATASQAQADAATAKTTAEQAKTTAEQAQDAIDSLSNNYYTKQEVDVKINAINELIGKAIEKTNEILG